jgi:hypothetical protein
MPSLPYGFRVERAGVLRFFANARPALGSGQFPFLFRSNQMKRFQPLPDIRSVYLRNNIHRTETTGNALRPSHQYLGRSA